MLNIVTAQCLSSVRFLENIADVCTLIENFKTWLFTIARRTAIDLLRKKRSLLFSEFEHEDGQNMLIDKLTDAETLPDEDYFVQEQKEKVGVLLDKLSPLYKEVMVMHYDDELTFLEIATILDTSIDTIKSRHRRSLLTLRKFLNRDNDTPALGIKEI